MVIYSKEFSEFCDSLNLDDPGKLIDFLNNNIYHDGTFFDPSLGRLNSKHIMQWPELTIKKRCGNCVDLAYLVYSIYQYFKSRPLLNRYDSAIMLLISVATTIDDLSNRNNDKRIFAHAIPMISLDDDVYIVNCDSCYDNKGNKIKNSSLFGSFKSFDLASGKLFELWQLEVTKIEHSPILFKGQRYLQYCVLYEKDLEPIDKYYGNTMMYQGEILNKIYKVQVITKNIEESLNMTIKTGMSDRVTYVNMHLNNKKVAKFFNQTMQSIKRDYKNSYIKTKMFKCQ